MAQFTTGYNSIPLKPTVGPSSITKGIANRFGREYTLKNVDNFQKTLVKYIDENRWDKTFQLDLWGLHNNNVPEDWKTLIGITDEEIRTPPPLGKGRPRAAVYNLIIERRTSNLKWCVSRGYSIMAKYLINTFHSVSKPERYLSDILFIAIEHDNKGVITELLNNGADPNIKEERTGKTLLMLAIEMRNVELVKELLSHDADPNIKDNNGRSARDAAKDTEHKETIGLLTPFSTVAKEVRQDMRSNGIPINEDNNKGLSVVAYSPLSRKISEYLREGGKIKKTNKKRKLRKKTVKRKTKKNNKKNINKK